MNEIISEAIHKKVCISLHYDGFDRIVEPHAYGITNDGNEVMRIWQTQGGSNSGKMPPWRLFTVREAKTIKLTEQSALTPRPGYKKGDKAMRRIFSQI